MGTAHIRRQLQEQLCLAQARSCRWYRGVVTGRSIGVASAGLSSAGEMAHSRSLRRWTLFAAA